MTFASRMLSTFAAAQRYRVDIYGGIFFLIVFAGAVVLAWEFDVFLGAAAQAGQPKSIAFDEALALLALLTAGLVVFGTYHLRQRREAKGRIAAEQEARRLALEDPLTGLPNRRRFEDALKIAVGSPPRAGASHGVLLLDLNGFKRVNDVHGHPVGDELLRLVANRVKGAVRVEDLVARLGGDEFGVLAPHLAGPDAATTVALRVIESLANPIAIGSAKHQIGTAIGIALLPQDGPSRDEVLRKADIALYRAKSERHSALRFFEPAMDATIREHDLLENELRSAVAADAIRPHYQPIIDLKSGAIAAFEALARWTHSTLGEVEPARFIPIAEACGLIGELTERLLRKACRDAAEWPGHVLLCFNISPVQLGDVKLGDRLMSVLGEAGFPPQRLEIEITESAFVRDMEAAQSNLSSIRAAGVRIALDDFGTGYSSLYHLRNFKPERIKIDRSFVEAMAHDGESAAIVRALIGLGSGFGLAVTAEGIEDSEQRALLAAQGCQQVQGFLYSRAVPAREALALLREAAARGGA